MAMIKCPECGQEISDKAKKCIHCGKILVEEKTITKKCEECGKENPNDAEECIYCGYPFEDNQVIEKKEIKQENPIKKKRKIKKIIIPVISIVVVGIAVLLLTVIIPKNIYNNAITLLENGKYEEADKKLNIIKHYKNVTTIKEQIKWESRVYECVTDLKQHLKNPDSLQIYEVQFYQGYKPDITDKQKKAMDNIVKLANEQPICIMHRGGQNGFGGNTTGYSLFLCNDDSYEYIGSCDTLDESKIKDSDEKTVCQIINIYEEVLEQVGDVNLNRVKTLIKNDSYSTIKIIN